eukprot:176362_1
MGKYEPRSCSLVRSKVHVDECYDQLLLPHSVISSATKKILTKSLLPTKSLSETVIAEISILCAIAGYTFSAGKVDWWNVFASVLKQTDGKTSQRNATTQAHGLFKFKPNFVKLVEFTIVLLGEIATFFTINQPETIKEVDLNRIVFLWATIIKQDLNDLVVFLKPYVYEYHIKPGLFWDCIVDLFQESFAKDTPTSHLVIESRWVNRFKDLKSLSVKQRPGAASSMNNLLATHIVGFDLDDLKANEAQHDLTVSLKSFAQTLTQNRRSDFKSNNRSDYRNNQQRGGGGTSANHNSRGGGGGRNNYRFDNGNNRNGNNHNSRGGGGGRNAHDHFLSRASKGSGPPPFAKSFRANCNEFTAEALTALGEPTKASDLKKARWCTYWNFAVGNCKKENCEYDHHCAVCKNTKHPALKCVLFKDNADLKKKAQDFNA